MFERSLEKLEKESTGQEREKDNASMTRQILVKMRDTLYALGKLPLPKEPIREVSREIEEMLRIANAVSISIVRDEMGDRLPDFIYFREYMRGKEPDENDFEILNLTGIVLDVIRSMEEYAAQRNVEIRTEFSRRERVLVRGHKTLLNRAFYSLIHNAIKYTWSKGEERQPWLSVRIEKNLREHYVLVTIENWGVPIRKEELETGAIFEFGIRGKEFDDRNRSGTGIGLYDAKDIITRHKGSLELTSNPTFGNPEEVYTNPFITRVFIKLPIVEEA